MKKKILFFSDCFTYSGSEVVIENLLKSEVISSHFDVNFLYGFNRSYDKRLRERMKYLGISEDKFNSINLITPDIVSIVRGYHKNKWSFNYFYLSIVFIILRGLKFLCISHIINFISLRHRIGRVVPDIIYINNGGYPASLQCIVAVFVARSLRIKTVYFNINNMAMSRTKWYHGYMDLLINRCVTKFITASYAAQEQAVVARQFSRESFVRIPNTIFNDLAISKKYGAKFKTEIFRFGSVGLFTERKGYHVLIRAIEILVYHYKIKNFELLLIGEGEEKDNLEKLVESCKVQKFVSFLKYQPQPLDHIFEFDVFVLPSIRNEDFPYVILEAMVLAKPVVSTFVAGIPEQIDNQISGLVIQPNNPIELAAALKKSMEGDFKQIAGLNGRVKYFNEFSYSKVEGMYFDLFRV